MICFILVIGGCSQKNSPSWIVTSNQQIERFKESFLTTGQTTVTEAYFRKALEEIKKSGNLDLIEKAWLTRMALQVAVLQEIDGGDYRKIADVKPVPANENFFLFLTGNFSTVDNSLLPVQYKGILSALREGDLIKTSKAISSIQNEPVSQLISAGLALRQNMVSEAIIQTAVDTASQNGWKAALLTWMERLVSFYEASGEVAKSADVRRHIDLIKE
jgi:hypothetical protein